MNYYSQEELLRLQRAELQIFWEFKRVCEKHNLQYFLYAGSALGAVRHNGFIPWDDDIDVAMPRRDFDKFIKIAEQDLKNNEFYIAYPGNCKAYPEIGLKMMMKNTSFVTQPFRNVKCPMGIFIDIMALDNVPDETKERKCHIRKTWFWHKLYLLKNISRPQLYFKGWKKKIIRLACVICHALIKLLPFTNQKIYQKFRKNALAYNGKTDLFAILTDTYPENMLLSKEDIYPLKKHMFEGQEVCLIHNVNKMLTSLYGDYMVLPKKEKQITHAPLQVKFAPEVRDN